MRRRAPLPLLLAAALPPVLAAQDAAPDLIVRGKRLVVAADTVLADGSLLLRGGKVAYVGADIPAEARARAAVVDYGDATIVPGFVLPPTTLTRDRDLAEGALPFTPDLRVAEAFDPWQPELAMLPRHGVTAVVLSPSPRNVAAGLGALVKPGRDAGRLVAADLHLLLSLAATARNPERPPTSLMGAVDLLRTGFDAARAGGAAGPDVAVLREGMQGSRPIAVHADSHVELVAALDLARDFGFAPVLIGARDAEKVLPRLLQQQATVVLDSLRPEQRLAELSLPTMLAEAGVPFCFGGRPELQRLSAVLAIRHGLDRRIALQALTRAPAIAFGQQAAVGSLRQGCAADFTVWTGDPLDLDSAHVATWVDGVRVHGDAPRARPASTAPATAAAGEPR